MKNILNRPNLTLLIGATVAIFILSILFSCEQDTPMPDITCGTLVQVKDMRGLDGCTFLFELENGEFLEPVPANPGWCGTLLPDENPLRDFNLKNGQWINIGYREATNAGSICMAGKLIYVTCIEEVDVTD